MRALGWPLLVTGLALLLGIVALTQPMWVYQRSSTDGDVDRYSYSWTVVVREQWADGVWAGTSVTPYSSPTFNDLRMREAIGASYLISGVYAAILFGLGLTHLMARSRRGLEGLVFIGSLLALAAGLASAVYPMLAIAPAAAAEVNSAIGGFTGSVPGPGANTTSWGPGAAWWLWVLATALSGMVFLVPLLQRRSWTRPFPTH